MHAYKQHLFLKFAFLDSIFRCLTSNEVKLDIDFYFNFLKEENWLSNKSYFIINHLNMLINELDLS